MNFIFLNTIFVILCRVHYCQVKPITPKQDNLNIESLYICLTLKVNKNKTQFNYQHKLQAKRNSIMHSLMGNKQSTYGVKLSHLNKGNSQFPNKINQLQNFIQNHNPDVLSISEANLKCDDVISVNQFPDYFF